MKSSELWNKVTRKLHISLKKEKNPLNFQEISALQTTEWHEEHLDFPASDMVIPWAMHEFCATALERMISLDFGEVADSGLRLYGTIIPLSTIKQDKGWKI